MKINQFFCLKVNQEQTFSESKKRLVVTKLKAKPLKIKNIRLKDKDGYWAYQVEIDKGTQKLALREIKLTDEPVLKPGDEIKVNDILKPGDEIKVSGVSKGKGFAGVVKRWGFKGGPKTHGQSDRERAIGSIGQRTDPGRIWKGKKMPGHMGVETKTIKGLKVFKVDEEKNEIWVTGLVPGGRNSLIKIIKLAHKN